MRLALKVSEIQAERSEILPLGAQGRRTVWLDVTLKQVAPPRFCGSLEPEQDCCMRPASRVVTKKEMGRKRIIQVGLTQLCGLGRFPGHTARCRAPGRREARTCVVTEREVRGRAGGCSEVPLTLTHWYTTLLPSITSRPTPRPLDSCPISNGHVLSLSTVHMER